jgi:ATP-binding cassette subfamily B protein
MRTATGVLRSVAALLWEADARLLVVLGCSQAAQSLVPLAELWIAKLVIDRLVAALPGPHPATASTAILLLIGIALGLAVVRLAASEIVVFARQVLAERSIGFASLRVLEHVQRLDLETLENPKVRSHLRRVQEGLFFRPAALLFRLVSGLQGTVTLVTAAVLLVYLFPLALPLLVLAAVPYAAVQSGAAADLYSLSMGQTPETREAQYVASVLSGTEEAKEVRALGLGAHLLGRYRATLAGHERLIAAIARRRGLRSLIAALLPAAVYAGIFAFLGLRALDRTITVGDLTLYIGLVLRSQDALQQLTTDLSGAIENSLFMREYEAFMRIPPPATRPGRGLPAPALERVIRFEGVSYRYEGQDSDAVRDITLELPAGRTVAIVGENGAGKTTLVKLLTGLYRPQAGRILADGVDICHLDEDEWRGRIAVIFQDFIHYAFTAAENIGLGQVERLDDRARIVAAAEQAGAGTLIADLPQGYDTALGRLHREGAQLSGGQWQRIALARAFMRDAPLLVLDEPTAALDARAEFEVFRVLRDLTRGRTVLLISHRFSTVRLADYIYVLDGGRLIESGTHEQLVRSGGQYAELFELQAAGYRPHAS